MKREHKEINEKIKNMIKDLDIKIILEDGVVFFKTKEGFLSETGDCTKEIDNESIYFMENIDPHNLLKELSYYQQRNDLFHWFLDNKEEV